MVVFCILGLCPLGFVLRALGFRPSYLSRRHLSSLVLWTQCVVFIHFSFLQGHFLAIILDKSSLLAAFTSLICLISPSVSAVVAAHPSASCAALLFSSCRSLGGSSDKTVWTWEVGLANSPKGLLSQAKVSCWAASMSLHERSIFNLGWHVHVCVLFIHMPYTPDCLYI